MSSRLSDEQWQAARRRALHFRLRVVAQGKAKGFAEVFRLAATQIEEDVEGFCDRAEMAFEEIEAFGQEPQLDDDWIDELTGEKDNFYFSTDSLVDEVEPLPGNRGKARKRKEPSEAEVVQAVEEAVQNLEDAISVSHSENVEDWIGRIAIALEKHQRKGKEKRDGMEFWHLQRTTRLKPSALFLGLLLGNQLWTIRQDSFYGDVLVTLMEENNTRLPA